MDSKVQKNYYKQYKSNQTLTPKEILEFISKDITNIIQLKKDSELNISTIVKYYALSLTALFSFIVFYENYNGSSKILFSYIGLFFVLFAVAATYYTSYTISRNIKRKALYRREIVNLRAIANKLMGGIYNKKTVCSLDDKLFEFTKFFNLPTIAILIGTIAPFLSYHYLEPISKDLLSYNIASQVVIILTAITCAIMLNLYTHHTKEMLIAKHFHQRDEKYSESGLYARIARIDNKRKDSKTSKIYKKFIIIVSIVLLVMLYFHTFINLEYFIAPIFILLLTLLTLRTRHRNFYKNRFYIWLKLISKKNNTYKKS